MEEVKTDVEKVEEPVKVVEKIITLHFNLNGTKVFNVDFPDSDRSKVEAVINSQFIATESNGDLNLNFPTKGN